MPGKGGRRSTTWSSTWNHGETKTIRVPIALSQAILDLARAVDEGKTVKVIDDDCASQDNDCLSQDKLIELRDRVLGELKLGRQAPGYKAAAKALDSFIFALTHAK